VKPLALALMLCAALRADMIFSTGSASAVLISGQYHADTLMFNPVSGTAVDGQLIPLPLLTFTFDCYRSDPACLYNTVSATLTVPVSLTDTLGETLTAPLSYSAGEWVDRNGIHHVTGGYGASTTFMFSDGEQWMVREAQVFGGNFSDGDQVTFGSLSFAEVSSVPEPSSLSMLALLLIDLASLRWQQSKYRFWGSHHPAKE
jgi:hypothetical protein